MMHDFIPVQNSFTTGVWHPSGDTFPPSTAAARSLMPCTETPPAQSLYMEENVSLACQVSLQSFHGAVCAEQWISVLVVTLCLHFHRESWQLQWVWACQYEPRPQLTLICVSYTTKLFFFFFYSVYKKEYRARTHTLKFKEHQMKWSIYLRWLSGELLLPSSIQSLHASLDPVNDIRA